MAYLEPRTRVSRASVFQLPIQKFSVQPPRNTNKNQTTFSLSLRTPHSKTKTDNSPSTAITSKAVETSSQKVLTALNTFWFCAIQFFSFQVMWLSESRKPSRTENHKTNYLLQITSGMVSQEQNLKKSLKNQPKQTFILN